MSVAGVGAGRARQSGARPRRDIGDDQGAAAGTGRASQPRNPSRDTSSPGCCAPEPKPRGSTAPATPPTHLRAGHAAAAAPAGVPLNRIAAQPGTRTSPLLRQPLHPPARSAREDLEQGPWLVTDGRVACDPHCGSLRPAYTGPGWRCWKSHLDDEPVIGAWAEGEGSVVCFDDALDDGQAEADTCVVGAYACGAALKRFDKRRS
jgi:hypothetical protein